MTMDELRASLVGADIDDRAYEIDGLCPGGVPADGAIYVRPEDGRWVAGVYERGRYDPLQTFATEDAAGNWVYQRLTRRRPMGHPLTAAEEEAARERSEQMVRDARERIRAAREQAEDGEDRPP
jgi:hypothetical protein